MINTAVSHTVNHRTQRRHAAGVQFRGCDQTRPPSGTWPAMGLVLEGARRTFTLLLAVRLCWMTLPSFSPNVGVRFSGDWARG
jgi:hypothetical protein